MVQHLDAEAWARQQFAGAELGDRRLNCRLVHYGASACSNPSASIPDQCGCWKDTKGTYRLFDNDATTHQAVIQPHLQYTRQLQQQCRIVLQISDTTTLSFDHPCTVGFGPTGSRGQGSGILLHNTLAVDVSGGIDAVPQVLGLSHQQIWTREPLHPKRKRSSKSGNKPLESAKWPDAIAAVGAAPADVRFIHVSDAESDCWETLAACRQQPENVGHVIRACQDRLVGLPDEGPQQPPSTKLFDLVRAQPPLGEKSLWVRGRGNEQSRQIRLLISATAVLIHPPSHWSDESHPSRKNKPRPQPLLCWAVRVWEAHPPADREAIEWVLLTDQPVNDRASALLVAFWYSCRWLVEEYHKCLKSGCKVEQRQLEHVDRLTPLIGVLSVVAVRLLQLKHQARVNPNVPAIQVVPKRYVRTLAAHLKMAAYEKMTARQFWRATAQLGGFLARKSDGDPGWQTLWRGWWKLDLMTEGAELARKMR